MHSCMNVHAQTIRQSYVNEYSLGAWMEKADGVGIKNMNTSEVKSRVHLLRYDEVKFGIWTPCMMMMIHAKS